MKRLFNIVLLVSVLASCSTLQDPVPDSGQVMMSVGVTGAPAVRAEAGYSDKVSWFDLYVYDTADGSLVWAFEDMAYPSADITVNVNARRSYTYVAVANSSVKFASLSDYESALYSLKDIGEDGLVMSDSKVFTATGSDNSVTLGLRRLMSRLSVEKVSVKVKEGRDDLKWTVGLALEISDFPYQFPYCARVDDASCRSFDLSAAGGRDFYNEYMSGLNSFQESFLESSVGLAGTGSSSVTADAAFYRMPQHHSDAQARLRVDFTVGDGDCFRFYLTLPYMEANVDYRITEIRMDSTAGLPVIEYTATVAPWVSEEQVMDIE